MIVTADLQGRALPDRHAPEDTALPLLGEAVAEELHTLAQCQEIPPLDRVGVVLAGDLCAVPDARKMGASGDMRPVWRASSNSSSPHDRHHDQLARLGVTGDSCVRTREIRFERGVRVEAPPRPRPRPPLSRTPRHRQI
ncbi:hypothetical protein DB30_01571 [Enhygromyxa salina]|uniref:Uncharacterized protein n=2 Tax=Enhygromyxa salina TaxID=215803 RepID=A0A0C1Z3U7_9BACT|nr:hypothetical protein DB30_01571 [Enhygromyxa salina]